MPAALPLLVVGYALGLLLASQGLVVGPAWAGVGLLGCLLALRRRYLLGVLTSLLLTAAVAGASALHRRMTALPPCSAGRHVGRAWLRLEVEALEAAQVRRGGGWRQRVRAVALLGREPARSLCGNIDLTLHPSGRALRRGERGLLRTRLRAADTGRNPGSASLARYHWLGGIVARAHAVPDGLLPLGRRPSIGWLDALRERVRRALRPVPGRPRAILAALVLGERAELDPALRERFGRSGLGHLLAVSGLHLSLVALGLLALLTALLRRIEPLAARGDPRALAALAAFGAAVLYTLLTGAAPPTVRACIMTGLLLAALSAARSPDFLRPLSAAALVLLLLEPLNLFRPAFQLSFAAVSGIVLALRMPWLRAGLAADRRPERWWGAARWLLGLAVVSAAASLATAPLVARHFGSIPLLGVASNLLAVPLTTFVLLPAALLGALLGAIAPALGQPVLALAGWSAEGLAWLAEATAAVPGSALPLQLGWLLTLAALAALLIVPLRAGARRLAALVALGLLAARVAQAALPAPLAVTFLDVGQGDATLLQLPGGTTVLVDAGGCEPGGFDPGERYVVPALKALGVRRLDLLVLTHPHADHVGGAKAVLEHVPVGEVWACWHDRPNAWIRRVRGWTARRGVPLLRPRVWRRGAVRLRPLWPRGETTCGDPELGVNDNSIVLRVEHGDSALLLAGDIEELAETALLAENRGALPAPLLKVPHHGSATSSSEPWLDAVRPALAVVSSGRGNRFGLPHAAIVERYRGRGIELLRIDRLGAVRVELPARGPQSWRRAHSPFR